MSQLIKFSDAKAVAEQLGSVGFNVTAIYIPEYDGPFEVPSSGDSKFYHFAFGAREGFTAKLVADLIKKQPFSWPASFGQELFAASPLAPEDVLPRSESWAFVNGAWVKE